MLVSWGDANSDFQTPSVVFKCQHQTQVHTVFGATKVALYSNSINLHMYTAVSIVLDRETAMTSFFSSSNTICEHNCSRLAEWEGYL